MKDFGRDAVSWTGCDSKSVSYFLIEIDERNGTRRPVERRT